VYPRLRALDFPGRRVAFSSAERREDGVGLSVPARRRRMAAAFRDARQIALRNRSAPASLASRIGNSRGTMPRRASTRKLGRRNRRLIDFDPASAMVPRGVVCACAFRGTQPAHRVIGGAAEQVITQARQRRKPIRWSRPIPSLYSNCSSFLFYESWPLTTSTP
jgi:hypothetical protein